MHHSDPAEQLRVAASQGHLSKCRELLERHQNIVNERGRDESTALFRACYNGHLEIVKLLVANGADIERKCTDFDCIVLEITPLMSACKKQDVSVIEYLLSAGARLEEISKYQGCTYVEVNEDLVGGLIAWRKAVSKEGVNELINNGDVKVDIDWSNAEKRRIYKGYPKEAITLQEVDNLANDIDAIYTQALLIKERPITAIKCILEENEDDLDTMGS
ncbi:ankyrin repeats (many copies) domain-containing protein [Ditylenchus destructor]|nr:ankyrin repeats (many copies) domain-containing protein [Ditylenchus destructor]